MSDLRLGDAVAALGLRHRSMVVMRYYLGWSDGQIARLLRVPPGTVKRRVHRAVTAVERHLGLVCPEDELRSFLESCAKAIDPGEVFEASSGRSRRVRPWVAVAAGVVAVAAIGGSAFVLGPGSGDQGEVADPAAVPIPFADPFSAGGDVTSIDDSALLGTDPNLYGPLWSWVRLEEQPVLGDVVSFAELDGRFFVFGHATAPASHGSVIGFVSEDGLVWEPLGEVIPGASPSIRITEGGPGLIAVGAVAVDDSETETLSGPSDTEAAVWTSTDGVDWDRTDLPYESGDEDIPSSVYATAVMATASGVTVLGSAQPDIERLVLERLSDDIPGLGELQFGFDYGLSIGGPPFEVMVHGPDGMVLYAATAEELGLDESVFESVYRPGNEPIVWTSSDFATWTRSSSNPFGAFFRANRVVALPDGDVLVTGLGEHGPRTFRSTDGLTWSPASRVSLDVDRTVTWNSDVIGATASPRPGMARWAGDGWEPMSMPYPGGADWQIGDLAASGYGLAVILVGYDESGYYVEHEPEPVTIEQDGLLITFDQSRGAVTVERDDQTVLTVTTWNNRPSEHVSFDAAARTITFHDPETGDVLTTLLMPDLAETLRQQYPNTGLQERSFILFTPDGARWAGHGSDGLPNGPAGRIERVLVTDNAVVVFTRSVDTGTGIGFNPRMPGTRGGAVTLPPLEVWAGTLT